MSERDEIVVAEIVDRLAEDSRPEEASRLDRQFAEKLGRLESTGQLPPDVLDDLRLFWRMLKAPDRVVPWRSKALIMAALTYFVAPIDAIPDVAGKLGYLDDAQVVRIVKGRIGDAIAAFEKS